MKLLLQPALLGVEWFVYKTFEVPVVNEATGRPKLLHGRPYTTRRRKRVGSVWAPDKAQAEVLARAYYGDSLDVQSAASAAVDGEFASAFHRNRRPVALDHRRGRSGRAAQDPRHR